MSEVGRFRALMRSGFERLDGKLCAVRTARQDSDEPT